MICLSGELSRVMKNESITAISDASKQWLSPSQPAKVIVKKNKQNLTWKFTDKKLNYTSK